MTILKIYETSTGRTWNPYLEKYEDECMEDEVKIANVILELYAKMDKAKAKNYTGIYKKLAHRISVWEEILEKQLYR